MNYPFRFAAASAGTVLVVSDPTTNLILKAIRDASTLTEADKTRFELLGQPLFPGWLYNFTLSSNADAVVDIGCYDGTNFYPAYSVSLLAAGSNDVEHQFNTGFALPLGGAVQPALKLVTGTSVVLCGHMEIIPNAAARDATPIVNAPTELLPLLL